MPKKPRDSIFYRYTLSEETVKEKEQRIVDLEEEMGKLQFKLYESRMVGSELERVQKEHELACQDRDSWKERELKAEADIWKLKTKDRRFNVHLKQKSVLADKLMRTVSEQHQYIKQLEAECKDLKENEKILRRNVEWLQKKRGEDKEMMEANVEELRAKLKQVTEGRDQIRASNDFHIERDQFSTSERARYEKEIDMYKLANRMQALRREASEDCKNDPILNMKGFSSAIEQDSEVRAILRRQEGLVPCVDEVIGYLAGRMVWADMMEDTSGFWLDAEKRIADLHKDNEEFLN